MWQQQGMALGDLGLILRASLGCIALYALLFAVPGPGFLGLDLRRQRPPCLACFRDWGVSNPVCAAALAETRMEH